MTQRKIALSIEEAADYTGIGRNMRTPLCKISSTGEIEQRFRLN